MPPPVDISLKVASGIPIEALAKVKKEIASDRLLDEAGALLLNRIRTRFLAETATDGSKWPQSAAAKKRRAAGGTGTLFASGKLFRSIQLSRVGLNERAIETDVPYGLFHQEGIGQVKREFIGASANDQTVMGSMVLTRLEDSMK